jgi:uncharacterized membrane protein YfcA
MSHGTQLLHLLAGAAVFLIGGLVKGVLGLGLPLIPVPVLSHFIPVPKVIGLMTMPALVSNFLQGITGANRRATIKRFWPLMAGLVLGIVIGTRILVTINLAALRPLLGGILVVLVLIEAFKLRVRISVHRERLVGLLLGLVTGFVTAVSSFMGPLVALFLFALDLSIEDFVAAFGFIAFAGIAALTLSLAAVHILRGEELFLSIGAVVPVLLGMEIGKRIRGYVPQRIFRLGVYALVAVVALNLLVQGLLPNGL